MFPFDSSQLLKKSGLNLVFSHSFEQNVTGNQSQSQLQIKSAQISYFIQPYQELNNIQFPLRQVFSQHDPQLTVILWHIVTQNIAAYSRAVKDSFISFYIDLQYKSYFMELSNSPLTLFNDSEFQKYIHQLKYRNNCRHLINQTRRMIKSLKNGAYQYSESDFLGEGSFAKVYKGVITKNNRVIAVRILPLKLIKQYGEKIKDIISGEVRVLKQLADSDSIDYLFTTRVYDCFMTENNITMILEFCPDGNLEDVINKRGGIIPEQQAVEIMYQLARGIQFIAREKVVHRDIKPDNIFVKKQKNHTLYKIGDFGFAVKKQINEQIVGTPIFMSPQIFKEQAYGSEVDVWAFGLMCHYMLFHEYYFIGASQKEIKKKVLSEQYKLKQHHIKKISPQMIAFLTGCLQMDKNKRIKATELSQHMVFNKVKSKVELMIQEIKNANSIIESQIQGQSAKGRVARLIMSFQFLFNLAEAISRRDKFSLTSLYMVKWNLAELNFIRNHLHQKNNFLNLQDWQQFASSKNYKETLMILETIFFAHQKCFDNQYQRLIQAYSSQGPQVIQGIQKNLGNGPLDRINPAMIVHDITNIWMERFKGQNSPEGFVKSLECILAYALYQHKSVEIDFVALEVNKTSITLQEKCQILENALKKVG